MPRLPPILAAAIAAALAAVLTLSLAGPVAAGASAASAPGAASRYATDAESATNAERTSRDRRALGHSRCLKRFAKRQARRMAAQRRIFHQSMRPIMRRCALDLVGENVAEGSADGEAVVAGWMGSPGHRANILRAGFRQQAVAARRAGGRWYVAQVFGRRR